MRICHVFGLYFNDRFKGTCFLFSRKLLFCNMLVSIQHFKACQKFHPQFQKPHLLKNYFVEKSMKNSRENNFFQNHFRILQRSKLSTCNRIPEERNALIVQSKMEKRWFPGDTPVSKPHF